MTRLGTPGYKRLRAEYNIMFDGHDPWGSNIEWMFALSELLTHWADGTPEEWDFHDSPAHDADEPWEPESHAETILVEMYESREFELADALTFGTVLNRYDEILRRAGLNY